MNLEPTMATETMAPPMSFVPVATDHFTRFPPLNAPPMGARDGEHNAPVQLAPLQGAAAPLLGAPSLQLHPPHPPLSSIPEMSVAPLLKPPTASTESTTSASTGNETSSNSPSPTDFDSRPSRRASCTATFNDSRRFCKTCKRWLMPEQYANEAAKTCKRCITSKKQKRQERKLSMQSENGDGNSPPSDREHHHSNGPSGNNTAASSPNNHSPPSFAPGTLSLVVPQLVETGPQLLLPPMIQTMPSPSFAPAPMPMLTMTGPPMETDSNGFHLMPSATPLMAPPLNSAPPPPTVQAVNFPEQWRQNVTMTSDRVLRALDSHGWPVNKSVELCGILEHFMQNLGSNGGNPPMQMSFAPAPSPFMVPSMSPVCISTSALQNDAGMPGNDGKPPGDMFKSNAPGNGPFCA